MFKPTELTPAEKEAADIARVAFMAACPFYCHYFYSEMREVFTRDIDTAATDGRHLFINPAYMLARKPKERVFIYAHEVEHAICRHCQRAKHYGREGTVKGLPWNDKLSNVAMDYVINAGLVEQGIGMMNPSWLYDPQTTGMDLWEDVYARIYRKGTGNGPGGAPGRGTTWGDTGKGAKGAKPDDAAEANGGGFDQILPPPVNPTTGKEDLPDEGEFKEAIARAAAAAKAMGKLPGSLKRRVDGMLEPQVNWREHVRMLMTGHMGHAKETWDRMNRRRLVLNPLVIMPGKRGYGANTVVCVVDNSGSVSERELSACFSEIGGVIADVRPKRVVLIWCDASIQQVDEAKSLDELAHIRVKGSPGGGGTDFRPPFEYLEREGIVPDTLIYLTDLCGAFPNEAPRFPVIWCATTNGSVPWGEVVRIQL